MIFLDGESCLGLLQLCRSYWNACNKHVAHDVSCLAVSEGAQHSDAFASFPMLWGVKVEFALLSASLASECWLWSDPTYVSWVAHMSQWRPLCEYSFTGSLGHLFLHCPIVQALRSLSLERTVPTRVRVFVGAKGSSLFLCEDKYPCQNVGFPCQPSVDQLPILSVALLSCMHAHTDCNYHVLHQLRRREAWDQ